MAWIGNTPSQQQFVPAVDYFSGNGSTTAFTLTRPVASVLEVEAVIENVPQKPSDAYTISGNTITFTSAPPAGSYNIYVRYTSPITQVIAPAQDSVGTAQLVNGAVTTAKMANSGFELGMRNRIINGAMMIDQRGSASSPVATGGSNNHAVDRMKFFGGGGGVFTSQQSSVAPSGFTNSNLITVTTADSSIAAGDLYWVGQVIEGYNVADLGWGTAGAATVTLSFWVRSSVTGTFSGSLNNGAYDRSYLFTYTINAVNTWEQKTITVTGDTSGTWLKTNGIGMYVIFDLGTGSTYTNSTTGSWLAGGYQKATGSANLIATNGATFYLTGVQLERGSSATAFDFRSYGTELALCQRYYYQLGGDIVYQYITATACGNPSISRGGLVFPVEMRAFPTFTFSAASDFALEGAAYVVCSSLSSVYATPRTVNLAINTAAGLVAGYSYVFLTNNTLNARLRFSAEL